MRIVGGTERGRTIRAPKGTTTRPTVDRVRESIMSSIGSRWGDLEGAQILDLFAGSGALGLEALSRGAAHGSFVDRDSDALRCVKGNCESLGYGPTRAEVHRADVFTADIPRSASPYDIAFLDPPYRTSPADLFSVIATAIEKGRFSQGALFVYEHDEDLDDVLFEAAVSEAGLEPIARKRYGATIVDYLLLPS